MIAKIISKYALPKVMFLIVDINIEILYNKVNYNSLYYT